MDEVCPALTLITRAAFVRALWRSRSDLSCAKGARL